MRNCDADTVVLGFTRRNSTGFENSGEIPSDQGRAGGTKMATAARQRPKSRDWLVPNLSLVSRLSSPWIAPQNWASDYCSSTSHGPRLRRRWFVYVGPPTCQTAKVRQFTTCWMFDGMTTFQELPGDESQPCRFGIWPKMLLGVRTRPQRITTNREPLGSRSRESNRC
jgi:hypothetical protein